MARLSLRSEPEGWKDVASWKTIRPATMEADASRRLRRFDIETSGQSLRTAASASPMGRSPSMT